MPSRTPEEARATQIRFEHGDLALLTPAQMDEADCDSAWKKDPVGGVIGIQKGPL